MAIHPDTFLALAEAKKRLDEFAERRINGKITVDYKDGNPVQVEEFVRTPIKIK